MQVWQPPKRQHSVVSPESDGAGSPPDCESTLRRTKDNVRRQLRVVAEHASADTLENCDETILGLLLVFGAFVVIWAIYGISMEAGYVLKGFESHSPITLSEFKARIHASQSSAEEYFVSMDPDHDNLVDESTFLNATSLLHPRLNASQGNFAFRSLDCNQDTMLQREEFYTSLRFEHWGQGCMTTTSSSTTFTETTTTLPQVASSTPAQALASAAFITGSFTVTNVDYAALSSDQTMTRAFVTTCQERIARGAATEPANVQVTLTLGSVGVNYRVTVPPSSSGAVSSALTNSFSGGDLVTGIVQDLSAIPSISNFVLGSMSITNLLLPQGTEAPTTAASTPDVSSLSTTMTSLAHVTVSTTTTSSSPSTISTTTAITTTRSRAMTTRMTASIVGTTAQTSLFAFHGVVPAITDQGGGGNAGPAVSVHETFNVHNPTE